MNPPNEDTLQHLNRLKHDANSVDIPLLAGELRQIAHGYHSWLQGLWDPSEAEVRGFFAERFAMARRYAQQSGNRRLAIALSALEDAVLQ